MSGCYVETDYIEDDYLFCDELPVIPTNPYIPTENISESFSGIPGVKINYPMTHKDDTLYPFVTSMIVECDQGEIDLPTPINNIMDYMEIFGDENNTHLVNAASFLQYSPSLLVTRCSGSHAYNASTEGFSRIKINTYEEFIDTGEDNFLENQSLRFIAQHPGNGGNKLRVSIFSTTELKLNKEIYNGYYAKDIINGMDDNSCCVTIFKESGKSTKIKEIFIIPFMNIESINTMSKYVYVRLNINVEMLDGLYDGNEGYYGGNLIFADGNVSRYYRECSDERYCVENMIKFFGSSIMILVGGVTNKALKSDLKETSEILDNIMDHNIDLHLGNNVKLQRKDCVNILGTPKGVIQAIDYKEVQDLTQSSLNESKNTFFIYGTKKINKYETNMASDYAGLRSITVLSEGLGVSNSKLSKPFNLRVLKTAPSLFEMERLYQSGINVVHNYKGIVICDGEIINKSTEG